jgi:hypothetical protein
MSSRITAAILVAAGLAVAPGAQAAKVGAGLVLAAGDIDDDAIGGFQAGAYFGIPAVERLSIGGDVTWFPVNGVTLLTFDPNVHFNLVQLPVLDVYPLAGLDIVYARASALGFSDTNVEVGLLVGAGAQAKAGQLRPFAEVKACIHGSTNVALSGGLRIAF